MLCEVIANGFRTRNYPNSSVFILLYTKVKSFEVEKFEKGSAVSDITCRHAMGQYGALCSHSERTGACFYGNCLIESDCHGCINADIPSDL
jgi:hypothetical protein